MSSVSRIGVLTGGGDAPGLNAVIRAVVKAAVNNGVEVIGLEDSFDGLLDPSRTRVLTPRDVTGRDDATLERSEEKPSPKPGFDETKPARNA